MRKVREREIRRIGHMEIRPERDKEIRKIRNRESRRWGQKIREGHELEDQEC